MVLQRLRSAAHTAVVESFAGRSMTCDLQTALPSRLGGADPAVDICVAPIVTWLRALWEAWIPRGIMARSMQEAIAKQDGWAFVVGLAKATVASLTRIGWSLVKPFVWKSPRGQEINIDAFSPKNLETIFKRDAIDWTWKQVAGHRPIYSHLTGAPLLQPILQIFRKPPGAEWSGKHAGMLRCFASAAPARETCDLCGSAWSQWHAAWQCDACARFRREVRA